MQPEGGGGGGGEAVMRYGVQKGWMQDTQTENMQQDTWCKLLQSRHARHFTSQIQEF